MDGDTFDNGRYLDDTHITDWPQRCLEVIRVAGCAFETGEIALLLNIPRAKVLEWEAFARRRIFGEFESHFSEHGVMIWVIRHEDCCLKETFEELRATFYDTAVEHRLQQPTERRDAIANHHIDLNRTLHVCPLRARRPHERYSKSWERRFCPNI